ncbi:unnamed protein product [Oikopleura dioica]|uniref:Uncharacterized protein n=1 Tax=Oikopleura dioica TaxID=34765 RepID=E4X7Y7_OIKDI|nr:unnamed protein product [Oikopleura dioica]
MQDWSPLPEDFYRKIKTTDPSKTWYPVRSSIVESLLTLLKGAEWIACPYIEESSVFEPFSVIVQRNNRFRVAPDAFAHEIFAKPKLSEKYQFDEIMNRKYTRIVDSVRKTVKVELRESAVHEINETFEVGGLCLEMEHQELLSASLDSCYIVTAVAYSEVKFSVSIGDSKRRGNSLHVENEVFQTNQPIPVAFKADLFPVDTETGELGMRIRHDGSELREGRWKKLVRSEEKALRVPVEYQYTETSQV